MPYLALPALNRRTFLRASGAALALPVWVDVMKRASADKYPANPFRGDRVKSGITASPPGDVKTEESGLRKTEPKKDGGVLRSFRRFFSGE